MYVINLNSVMKTLESHINGVVNLDDKDRITKFVKSNDVPRNIYEWNLFVTLILVYEEFDYFEKFMKEINKFDVHANNENIFTELCKADSLNSIKYLIKNEDKLGKFNIHANNDMALKISSKRGNIDIVKYLISLDKEFNINEKLLGDVCKRGHFKIFKFLLTLGKFDLHKNDEKILSKACFGGNLDLVKYLFKLDTTYKKFDIHAYNESAFLYACRQDHINVVKFLISLEEIHGQINIHVIGDSAFVYTCINNNIELAKYLISLEKTHGKIDINCDANGYIPTSPFEICCSKGYLDMIKYLLTLRVFDIKRGIELAKDHVDVVNFLSKL